MPILRLFHQSNPFKPIDARAFDRDDLPIGRDPGAGGWTIDDPDRELSRLHCVLEHRQGRVMLRDLSANGVYVGADRVRPHNGEMIALQSGGSFRLGRFLVVVEDTPAQEPVSFEDPFSQPFLAPIDAGKTALAVPTDWAGPAPAARPTAGAAAADGSLLEAFCAGARLEASTFAGEEPGEVMRRLGAVYQQMVLGLADMMTDRTSVKTDYRLERTSVQAEGNNPFRWAPPQRVAVDILRPRTDGFLSGPAAVKASFEDLKKHHLCMLAGLRTALSSTLDTLSPEAVEGHLAGRSFLTNRAGAAWNEYARLHAEFRAQAGDDPDSPMNREFRAGYDRRLQELETMSAA